MSFLRVHRNAAMLPYLLIIRDPYRRTNTRMDVVQDTQAQKKRTNTN